MWKWHLKSAWGTQWEDTSLVGSIPGEASPGAGELASIICHLCPSASTQSHLGGSTVLILGAPPVHTKPCPAVLWWDCPSLSCLPQCQHGRTLPQKNSTHTPVHTISLKPRVLKVSSLAWTDPGGHCTSPGKKAGKHPGADSVEIASRECLGHTRRTLFTLF